MIRCVHISADDDVIEGTACFAWYDTDLDIFLCFNGNRVWETWDNFVDDWLTSDLASCGISKSPEYPLDRFRGLCKYNEVRDE